MPLSLILERWITHEPTPGLLQTASKAEKIPLLSVPGNLAPSVLEAFFKLQQNLHHFIAIVSYLDLELAMTGSLAVYRKTERKGG